MTTPFVFDTNNTLTIWNDTSFLFPYTPHGDTFRGGAFWCIPNQGSVYDVFEKQNGEYRKTTAKENSSAKHLSGKWGSLIANTVWAIDGNTLVTKAVMTSLHEKTLLRPGFHPYFTVHGPFTIHIEGRAFTEQSLPSNTVKTVLLHKENKALLEQESGTLEISFHASSSTKRELSCSFALWSDNLKNYICIEPVVGEGEYFDGSVAPIQTKNGETITIEVRIHPISVSL